MFVGVAIAGIVAAAGYLQAGARGWRYVLAAFGLMAISLGLMQALMIVQGLDAAAEATDMKFFAATVCLYAFLFMFVGALAGKILSRFITPGRAGLILFVVAYLLVQGILLSIS